MNNAKSTSPDRSTFAHRPGANPSAAPRPTLDLSRLYRAYVSPFSAKKPELAVFVDGPSRDCARRRICELVALITRRAVDDVADALYNLNSGQELLEQGLSEQQDLRLFECSWSDSRIGYIDNPLFLVSDPGPLLQAWLRTRAPADEPNCAIVAAPIAQEGY